MTAPILPKEKDPVGNAVDWVKKNQGNLIIGVATLIIVIAFVMYWGVAQQRRENFANGLLETARAVAATGNTALAATDLASLATTHRGTTAAEEAAILLARIRLTDGQPEAAVTEMQRFISDGPSAQFRAPAFALLGNAFEQLNSLDSAAAAYNNAASVAWYDFLEAQYLIDAARVYTAAGDTNAAIEAYERILSELAETDMAMEARLRLGELRVGAGLGGNSDPS